MDFRYDWSDGGGEGHGIYEGHGLPPDDDDGLRLPLWVRVLFDATPALLMLFAAGFFLIGCEVIAHVVSCS